LKPWAFLKRLCNPVGINGNPSKGTGGAALVAQQQFGVKQGEKMNNCMSESGKAYGLVTVSYPGKRRSLSEGEITDNIKKLYDTASGYPWMRFMVAYRNTDKASLNGYTVFEMIEMFKNAGEIPDNVYFSEEWKNNGF